ncbi:hypothetical protein ACLVWU_04980 [Bdellovibrio sp. HCB290]|uniref:hypothetical protein n=1 Tax=Bdellovibrio sp. HCB290 TaxID=3394356 RepID=UPI0039B59A8B
MRTFLLALSLFVGISAFAQPGKVIRGNEGAYGGDEVGLEFKTLAKMGFDEIKREHDELAKLFSVTEALKMVDVAQVLAVDDNLQLEVNGVLQQVVMVNYPKEKKILINRMRWKAIGSKKIKQALAIHEILGLMRIEKTGLYPISSRFFGVDPELLNLGSCYLARTTESMDGIANADIELKLKSSASAIVFYINTKSDWAKYSLQNFAKNLGVADPDVVSLTYSQLKQAPSSCLIKENKIDCVDMMKAPTLVFLNSKGMQYPVESTFKRFKTLRRSFPMPLDISLTAEVENEDGDIPLKSSLDFQFQSITCD